MEKKGMEWGVIWWRVVAGKLPEPQQSTRLRLSHTPLTILTFLLSASGAYSQSWMSYFLYNQLVQTNLTQITSASPEQQQQLWFIAWPFPKLVFWLTMCSPFQRDVDWWSWSSRIPFSCISDGLGCIEMPSHLWQQLLFVAMRLQLSVLFKLGLKVSLWLNGGTYSPDT